MVMPSLLIVNTIRWQVPSVPSPWAGSRPGRITSGRIRFIHPRIPSPGQTVDTEASVSLKLSAASATALSQLTFWRCVYWPSGAPRWHVVTSIRVLVVLSPHHLPLATR